MKQRAVTQYICDYCGKRGLSASCMRTHEKHCTMNPDRECRVCGLLDQVQKPMAELLAVVPECKTIEVPVGAFTSIVVPPELLPKLREVAGDCPACIMAALRQRHIPVPAVEGFNFTQQMKAIWDDINYSNMESHYY